MTSYYNICKAFINGEKIEKRWLSRVGKNNGWGYGRGGGLYSAPGTRRMDVIYQDGVSIIRSYERMALAVRQDNGRVIVNADDGPSMMTRSHQRELRGVLQGVEHCLLPFSALRAAGIFVEDVVIVATTPDKEIETWKKCRCEKPWHTESNDYVRVNDDGTHSVRNVQHFLGETLFTTQRHPDRYYVAGLDRNDDPRKRNFYLAWLPAFAAPKSVDEALELLKPQGLPESGWLRQGEWFFVPKPGLKPVLEGGNVLVKETKITWDKTKPGVPITSANAEEAREAAKGLSWGRQRRHRATRMYINDSVYVSGMVRDEEHSPLKLGNGKTWYEVIRNRAVGSWSAGGQVD